MSTSEKILEVVMGIFAVAFILFPLMFALSVAGSDLGLIVVIMLIFPIAGLAVMIYKLTKKNKKTFEM